MRQLSIVIVNWNTGDGLQQCICSIEKQILPIGWKVEIIIVDNASKDHSLEYIHRIEIEHERNTISEQFIYNDQNLGFAKACNQGAQKANGEYLIFLNPDMILEENALKECIQFLEQKEPKTAVVGIQLVDEQGVVARSCSRLPKNHYFLAKCLGLNRLIKRWNLFMIEWDHQDSRFVDEVIGAFFLVEKCIFEKLGGFDERFFVYYEEVDFCKRVHDAGYKVFYYTEARAYHEGGGASGQVKDYRLFYELRSRCQYMEKHYGRRTAAITLRLEYLEYVTRYVFLYAKGRRQEIDALKRSYVMLKEWVKNEKMF